MTITQEQAEAWLKQDVAEAAGAVDRLLRGMALTLQQRDALISFCLNVGAGALERSTLRKRLLAGKSSADVIAEELPRWNKGPKGPLEGLKRRRAAEVSHAQTPEAAAPQTQMASSAPVPIHEPIQLLDAVRHHKGLAHQQEAWLQLERSLSAEQRGAFAKVFRTPASPSNEPPTPETPGLIQLPLPYLSQNDSATSQGPRMCFSSSCVMAAAFLKPDALRGPGQLDDQYLALVQRHGDTTDANAQVAAVQNMGLQARFRTDGSIEDLIEQLKRGLPCPVGWLHKGPVSSPQRRRAMEPGDRLGSCQAPVPDA